MKQSSALRTFILVGLVLFLIAGTTFAQTSNGTIAGTVTDPTGAVIQNATVTATSLQTGDTRSVTTNQVGAYRIDSVLPGNYAVIVKAQGFATTNVKSITVTASVVTSLNVALKLGASETVEVQAETQTLQTESGELSDNISNEEVENLPISSLNPYSLAVTLPGVSTVTSADFTNGTSFSVNGTRPRANNFLIEGQDNNDAGIHGQGIQPENLGAIKEVTVLTNSYSAEFGHGGGSVSNLILKSGTNQFHGSVWDRLENSSLDATDKADILYGSPKSKYRENLYGFTFGGPIVKDKLFFFTSYQWDKYRATANLDNLVVPTDSGVATLQGLGSNPRIANYLQAIGSLRGSSNPNLPDYQCIALGLDSHGNDRGCVEVGDVKRSLGAAYDSPEFDAKGDYIIGKNDTLSLRYIKTNFSAPYDVWNYPSQLPGFDTTQYGPSHNAGITYTHIFSPTLINEFRLSYGRIGFTFDFAPSTYNNPLALGPTIGISDLTGYGAPSGDPQGRFHNTYQYQDSLSWTKGNHFIKVGVDLQDTRVRDAVPYNLYGSLSYTKGGGYTALANYIDDYSGTNDAAVAINYGNPIVHTHLFGQSYFFQDSWKVRPNLTINYGVRYEYNGAPFNSLQYPALYTADLNCYTCVQKEQADGNDWGPRFGFSYSPKFWQSIFGQDKTVIRGGFGVFYDQLFTNIADNIAASSPNMVAPVGYITSLYGGRGMSDWSSALSLLTDTSSPGDLQEPITAHLLAPETLQWNLNIQRELPGQFMATIAYVGTRGEHLLANTEFNPKQPDGQYLDPNRGRIVLRDNTGDSIYHGLQTSLDRKFSHGLMLNVSYTYSKFEDDTSEIFSTGNWSSFPIIQYPSARKTTDWGLSAFDHRQRLTFQYVYAIPTWKVSNNNLRPIAEVVNGWQISGSSSFQSGTPQNVFVGWDVNGDGIGNDRPELSNPSAPLGSYAIDSSWGPLFGIAIPAGTLCDGVTAYNKGTCTQVSASSVHWLLAPLGTNGTNIVGRNSIISPGTQNWDFALQRTLKIGEKQSFDIRAEMFNVFNHGNTSANLASFTLLSGSTFADYPSTVAGHRNIRFLLKYSF